MTTAATLWTNWRTFAAVFLDRHAPPKLNVSTKVFKSTLTRHMETAALRVEDTERLRTTKIQTPT